MTKILILNSFIRCLIWVVVVGIFEVTDDRAHLSFQPLPAALKTYIHSIAAKGTIIWLITVQSEVILIINASQ